MKITKWLPVLVLILFIAALAALATTRNHTIPDPNDPQTNIAMAPDVLRRRLKMASDSAYGRMYNREIPPRAARVLVRQYADQLTKEAHLDRVDPLKAWEYGDVLRTANNWEAAADVYKIGLKNPVNTDRRVNDSLHCAQCLAHIGKIEEGIKLIRSTFDADPTNKGPILTSVLLEFLPAAYGSKGHEVELAKLLEDSIGQAEQTVVDGNSQAGKMFILAKHRHIRNAWEAIIQLYRDAKREDVIPAVMERAKADIAKNRVRSA